MAEMETIAPDGKPIPPGTVGMPHIPCYKKTRKPFSCYAGRSVQILFGNLATSAGYFLERLTSSSNSRLKAFKITVVIFTFPILALPLLFMSIGKLLDDRASFPRQARFSYDDQWSWNPPEELSACRLDLPSGKESTLTGYEIPPAPDVKHKGTVVYFHDQNSTAASIFQNKQNYIQCMVAKGYRVICATYPGYGGSSGMILSAEDVRRAGQVFVDYARTLITDDAPELVLWGCSTGANIAAQLAADNSKAVTKVVLQAPNGHLDASYMCEQYQEEYCLCSPSFMAVYVSCWLLIHQDQSTGHTTSSAIPQTINQRGSYSAGKEKVCIVCDGERIMRSHSCEPYDFNTRRDLYHFFRAGDDKEAVLLHDSADSADPVSYSDRICNFVTRPQWNGQARKKKIRAYTVVKKGVRDHSHSEYDANDYRKGEHLHRLRPETVISAALLPADSVPDSPYGLKRHPGDTSLPGLAVSSQDFCPDRNTADMNRPAAIRKAGFRRRSL